MADQVQGQAQASGHQGNNTGAMIWSDFASIPNGNAFPLYGYIYPAWVSTMPQPQLQEVHHPMWGRGVFAVVPAAPPMGCVPQFYPAGLVPITYSVSSPSNSVSVAEGNIPRAGEAVQRDIAAADRAHERHRSVNADSQRRRGRRGEQQRQRILRLIICLQAGLLLALKFAVSVFMYNRSGSKDRLRMMMFMNLANLFFLYKMGVFSPLSRWLSRRARRAMMPSRHRDQMGRVEIRRVAHADERQDLGWQGLRKEFQMIVIGFTASLFPGFRLSDYE